MEYRDRIDDIRTVSQLWDTAQFKAAMQRLGIEDGSLLRRVVIDMPLGDIPVVYVELVGTTDVLDLTELVAGCASVSVKPLQDVVLRKAGEQIGRVLSGGVRAVREGTVNVDVVLGLDNEQGGDGGRQ